MKPEDAGVFFALFTEIGILSQLSGAMLDQALPDGLIGPHFSVLNHLVRVGDGRTPVQIARAFQVPKTSMTHTLAGLERQGLVTMQANPKDARSKQVWLTKAGHQLREDTIGRLAPRVMHILDGADMDAMKASLTVLSDMRVRMDKARD